MLLFMRSTMESVQIVQYIPVKCAQLLRWFIQYGFHCFWSSFLWEDDWAWSDKGQPCVRAALFCDLGLLEGYLDCRCIKVVSALADFEAYLYFCNVGCTCDLVFFRRRATQLDFQNAALAVFQRYIFWELYCRTATKGTWPIHLYGECARSDIPFVRWT